MNKQIKHKALVPSLLFATLLAASGSSLAGISTTKHNLSTSGTGTIKSTTQTEICVFCHTPHGASTVANTPLWNHSLSAVTSYGVYSNTNSINASDITAITATDGSTSSLCLSCHDGTIAVNAQNNVSNNGLGETMTGGTGAGNAFMSATGNLGGTNTALTNDHPVNFTYNTTLATADTKLTDPTDAAGTGLGGPKLFTGKVQCASCHDVHDSTNVPFLRVTMSGSSLCLKCHVK